jgi:hypothetical protein
MSKLLDEARRVHWEACGEPPRPEYPPRHLLVEEEGFAVEPLDSTCSGDSGDWRTHNEQDRRHSQRCAGDAAAQIAWETEARDAAAAWRERTESEEAAEPPPAEEKDREQDP